MENLHSMSVNELSEAIQTMNLSPTELVSQLLDRSEQFNNRLQVWQTLDKDIPLMQAAIREKEMAKGNYIGPLDGIPIGIKDIIDVAGWPTKCNSPTRSNIAPANADAEIVSILKSKGAIIIGNVILLNLPILIPHLLVTRIILSTHLGGLAVGQQQQLLQEQYLSLIHI